MKLLSRRALGVGALYGALSIVFCLPLFTEPIESTTGWNLHLNYYARVIDDVFHYRQMPFWSPWSCGGNVLWQNPQVALVSPVYLLAMIVPLGLAVKIGIVFHYWIGFVGMHLLLTEVIGLSLLGPIVYLASLFTLCGALAVRLAVGHQNVLPAFYLPLLLFFVCRAFQTRTVRPALYAAIVGALIVYNGGLSVAPLVVLAVTTLAVSVVVAQRDWRPLALASVVLGCGTAFAAPRLAPIAAFVTSDQFRNGSDPIDRPDRMTPAMIWNAYTDSTRDADSRTHYSQRYPWSEYGNYIGIVGLAGIALGIAWILIDRIRQNRLLSVAFALAAVVFFVASAGEFHPFAPGVGLMMATPFAAFVVPSRYTIGFVLFGALALGAAVAPAIDKWVTTRRRRDVLGLLCAAAVAQLAIVNQQSFRNVFTAADRPSMRADDCPEPMHPTRSADVGRLYVWSDESAISEIVFKPNRVQFSIVGGYQPSKVFLNQNFVDGWTSTAGPILLDPAVTGKMYVQLAAGQTGTYAFSFMPPRLAAGMLLLLFGVAVSAAVWNYHFAPVATKRSFVVAARAPALSFVDRAERATKVVVLASIGLAMAARVFVAGVNAPGFAFVAVAAFAIACAASLRWEGGVSAVLASAFVAPAFFARVAVHDVNAFPVYLAAALVGAMVPRWSRGWSLPPEWRVPLVGWAVATAVAWPILALRELDFHPEITGMLDLPASAIGVSAAGSIGATADAALLLMLTVVWLDWLFDHYGRDRRRFQRTIVVPLLISGAVAGLVATYQLFVDISFLNSGWAQFRRAGGTMMDANAFGIAAVLCSCGFLAGIDPRERRPSAWMIAGFALSLLGVWASGSKTALVAEIVALGFAVESIVVRRAGADEPTSRRHGRRIVALAGAAGVLVSILFALRGTGPMLRLGWILPSASAESIARFVQVLWDRGGYGRAAIEMIASNPLFGIGVGSFPVIVSDYLFSHLGGPLTPDNAQNWIRHNLAELGLVGSLGWIVWAVVFAIAVFRPSRAQTDHRATIVAGALAGIVLISQFGMPTQNAAVAITFWTFVFWYYSYRWPAAMECSSGRGSTPSWQWMLMTALIVIFAAGTLYMSLTNLRVPMRARNGGWHYTYGYSPIEQSPSGDAYRWTGQHSVAVVPAAGRLVKVKVWTVRRDIATHPVLARVWHDRSLVIDTLLHDNRPVFADVAIDRDPRWLMLRTFFDRTVPVSPPAAPDLGLAIQWTYIDAPRH